MGSYLKEIKCTTIRYIDKYFIYPQMTWDAKSYGGWKDEITCISALNIGLFLAKSEIQQK